MRIFPKLKTRRFSIRISDLPTPPLSATLPCAYPRALSRRALRGARPRHIHPLGETNTRKFAFISRHTPTLEQHELAAAWGIELFPVGDRNAFYIDPAEFDGIYDGVIVVHPAAAIILKDAGWAVGVFENANIAPEGAPPQFMAVALHLFRAEAPPEVMR